jgi:periplasmic protein TonB
MMADKEPKRTYILEISFIISLAVVLLPLELMTYFSRDNRLSTVALDMEMPVVTIKIEDLMPATLHQQKNKPPDIFTPPKITQEEVIASNVLVKEEITKELITDTQIELPKEEYADSISGNKILDEIKDMTPLMVIDAKPSFPGGDDAMVKYLTANIKYPPIAKEAGITGIVKLTCLIEKDGSITDIKVVNGIGGGCNEEAIRVVKTMPKWTPGKQKGKTIRTQVQIPIVFFLRPS